MSQSAGLNSPGRYIANMLSGAWRCLPPELNMAPVTVDTICPLLFRSGAGALGWWRVRHGTVGRSHATLHAAYLRYALNAAQHERQVVEAISILRAAGLEPLLLKGWAVGRLYAESGLRPSGDIDLYLPRIQRLAAENALRAEGQYWADFQHEEIERCGMGFERLYDCSESVQLNGFVIRILGPEDQLRFLCLHFLKHGAWRPVWLCDIAARLESLPIGFDWDRCLGESKRDASWIAYSVILAKRLLGADLRNAPLSRWESKLPEWLPESVLEQWSHPYPANLPSFLIQMEVSSWKNAIRASAQRWPNPIQAIVDAGGYFDRWPPISFQLRNCLKRAVKLCCSKEFRKSAVKLCTRSQFGCYTGRVVMRERERKHSDRIPVRYKQPNRPSRSRSSLASSSLSPIDLP
jgi:hypothetical protein